MGRDEAELGRQIQQLVCGLYENTSIVFFARSEEYKFNDTNALNITTNIITYKNQLRVILYSLRFYLFYILGLTEVKLYKV